MYIFCEFQENITRLNFNAHDILNLFTMPKIAADLHGLEAEKSRKQVYSKSDNVLE